MSKPLTAVIAAAVLLAGCAAPGNVKEAGPAATASNKPSFLDDPYPSTYQRVASPPVLITGATVLTGTGTRIDNADVLLQDGRIVAVGTGLQAPAGATHVDGKGKWVTPG